jgi:small subunit ribosomal protein S4
MQPILKRCRTLGISPSVMGIDKSSNRNPNPMRRKQSEYGRQLTEKQKVKFVYGMLEKQFRKYYEIATKMQGAAGDNLLSLLESRLDNVIFRLGLANTRRESRQIVNHGHVLVNGKRLDIPSYRVKVGDVITLEEKTLSSDRMKAIIEANSSRVVPKWLDMDKNTVTGKVIAMPQRDDIDFEVEEHLIVELYSK